MVRITHPHHPIALMGILGILLLVLAACGPNTPSTTTGSGSGNTTHPTPTPTPTTTRGYGSMHGCPSDAVVSSAPKHADVIIRNTDINATVSAHIGNIIEVRLPFGHKWSGPVSIPSNLQQEQPAVYAFTPDNVCAWRFAAQNAGITQLDFYMQALCSNGQMCPEFVANIPFTIDIK